MSEPNRQPSEGGGSLDLKRYGRILYKRKWIAALFFVAAVAAVMVYTQKQRPIYRATVSVLIERTPPRVLAGTAEVVELGSTNYWSNKEYYQTQYNIIKSREISGRVVQRLGLAYDQRFLASVGPPRDGELHDPVDLAQALLGRIEVSPVKDSMIVEISVEDSDPTLAMELVNAVAQAYREYNVDRKQDVVTAADKDLETLVEERRKLKETAENEVVEFERTFKVGTLANERRVIDQAIVSGEAKLDELVRDIDRAAARLTALKRHANSKDIFGAAHTDILDNPFVLQLKQEIVRLDSDLSKLETDYLPKHPAVQATRNRLVVVEKTAKKEIENLIKAAQSELVELQSQKKEQDERLLARRDADVALADRQLEYERLVARRDQARGSFDKVSRRLVDTKMSAQIKVNNVDILDVARVPAAPVRPRPHINLVLGCLLGLFGGVALAFFVEFLDNTVKAREDVENLGLTFLGLVPTLRTDRRTRRQEGEYDGPKELYIHHKPMSTVAEFCRSIRTNLLFMMPERPLHSMLVTSPNPQEGKTTIAVSIGITMAASGGRTIIIDTDMRRPRLHEAFGGKAATGLSNYLIGEAPVTQFVRSTEVPNLDILPCGPCPPNPAELIHTRKFQQLIEELRQRYSTIIFDSPPVNVVTDALIIGNLVDGVVMVSKCGKTTREALGHARRQLLAVNARVLGCVVNDLDLESRSYGYYYSTSRYGYAYGDTSVQADNPT